MYLVLQTVRPRELLQVGHPLRQHAERSSDLSTVNTTATATIAAASRVLSHEARVDAARLKHAAAAAVHADRRSCGRASFLRDGDGTGQPDRGGGAEGRRGGRSKRKQGGGEEEESERRGNGLPNVASGTKPKSTHVGAAVRLYAKSLLAVATRQLSKKNILHVPLATIWSEQAGLLE